MPDDRSVKSGGTPLEKFCLEMDEQIFSNAALRRIFAPKPQPLSTLRNDRRTEYASAALQPVRLPDETDEAYAKRRDAALDRQVADATAPYVWMHERAYARLRSGFSLTYKLNTSEYKGAVEQVANQSKQTPEFIHAYISYRRDLLMQEFTKDDEKVKEDYTRVVRPVFVATHFGEQVEAMANRMEAERQADAGRQDERLPEKRRQSDLMAEEAAEYAQEVVKEYEEYVAAREAKKQEEYEEYVAAREAKKQEEDWAIADSMWNELARLGTRLAANDRASPAMRNVRSALNWTLRQTVGNSNSTQDLSDFMQDTLDAGRQYQREKAAQKGGFSSTQLDRLKTINYMLAVDYMLNQDPPIALNSDKGQKFMLAVKTVMSMEVGQNARRLCDGDYIIKEAETLQTLPHFDQFIKNSGKSIEELRKTGSPSFARQYDAAVKAYVNGLGTGEKQNARRAEQMPKKEDGEAEALRQVFKEAENRGTASAMQVEIERLRGRLAVNGSASPTMADMRTKLGRTLNALGNGFRVEELTAAMKETLDAGRQYQREKAAQKGGFSSTQLDRLKTINYMLAVDRMGKQDPPLSPRSKEGEKFMLAVKAVMSMAVGKDARLLCDGDKIIEKADALSRTPAFDEFIRNSGKSVEELRKTKSMSFARQFTAAMDEAEKKKAVQPVAPVRKNQNPVKSENRNLAV